MIAACAPMTSPEWTQESVYGTAIGAYAFAQIRASCRSRRTEPRSDTSCPRSISLYNSGGTQVDAVSTDFTLAHCHDERDDKHHEDKPNALSHDLEPSRTALPHPRTCLKALPLAHTIRSGCLPRQCSRWVSSAHATRVRPYLPNWNGPPAPSSTVTSQGSARSRPLPITATSRSRH